MIIKNAEVNAVIGSERFISEDKARYTLLLTIESNDNINPDNFEGLCGTMDIELHASKDAACPWQDSGKCTKGFYLGEPTRLWGSKKVCLDIKCP